MRTLKACLFLCLCGAWWACGGSSTANTPDAGGDATTGEGLTWELVSAPVMTIELYDPAPINTERTARVMFTSELSGCDIRAMPSVTWVAEASEVYVDIRAWRPLRAACPPAIQTITRPVGLRFPSAGTWTVWSGEPGSATRGPTVEVSPAPERACMPLAVGCQMDCDCPDGSQCIGSNGFAGPITQCAQACEVDRDCGGNGACNTTIVDGLNYFCDAALSECGDAACPTGYKCEASACQPDFVLDESTRTPCSSDADCAAPLRCALAANPEIQPRCELLCATSSAAWCPSPYACGQAADDTSGVAAVDAVCVLPGQ